MAGALLLTGVQYVVFQTLRACYWAVQLLVGRSPELIRLLRKVGRQILWKEFLPVA